MSILLLSCNNIHIQPGGPVSSTSLALWWPLLNKDHRPACIRDSSKSLSWPRQTSLPAVRPETSRQLGSVQNRRVNT